jgi:hypothetical protein
MIDASVRRVFNSAENWLLNHAGGPLVNVLEGGLLLVRRNLFHQAAIVIPSVQTTANDGSVTGRIGAYFLEGDTPTYTVVADPTAGSVTVDADGLYHFTPREGFTGSDAFTVRVAAEHQSLNLTNWRSDGSRVVRINVGSPTLVDLPDVGAYLPSIAGSVAVRKDSRNRFIATVTLPAGTNTPSSYMDTSGRSGVVTLDSLATQHWRQLQTTAAANGGGVNLTLHYTDADGAGKAVLLDGVQVGKDAAGNYTFTGQLFADAAVNPQGVDIWDVVGKELKPLYDAFRSDNSIGPVFKFAPVSVDFTKADVFVSTVTPLSYLKAGLYGQDSEANPQTAGSGSPPTPTTSTADAIADATANASGPNSGPVTTSVSNGRTVYIGRDDGSIEAWVQGERSFLNDPNQLTPVSTSTINVSLRRADALIVGRDDGSVESWVGNDLKLLSPRPGPTIPAVWKSPVKTLVEYNHPVTSGDGNTVYQTGFIAGLGNGSVQLWSDTTNEWIQLRGKSSSGAGVTTMINYGGGVVLGQSDGSVYEWSGPGTNPDTSSNTSTWANNWSELHNDGWKHAVTVLTPYKGYPSSCTGGCDGFLVGLDNGSVQQYNEATNGPGEPGWKELHDPGWASAVKGIVLSQYDGAGLPTFAVGLLNGAVEQWQWNGSGFTWVEIQKPGEEGWNSEITSMSQFGQNFIVGLSNGATEMRINPGAGNPYGTSGASNWSELHDAGWKYAVNQIVPQSATAGTGVYVGLDNGSVQSWNGTLINNTGQSQWTQLHDPGWDSGVRTLTQTGLDGGITVGLANGTLQQWTPAGSSPQDEWTQLVYNDPVFTTSVKQLLTYNRPLKDSAGISIDSSFTGYISGTTLTVTSLDPGSTVVVGSVITGEGVAKGTRITKYINASNQCIDSGCDIAATGGVDANSESGYTGNYEVSIAQTVGSSVPQPSPEDPEVLATAGIRLTQPGVPAVVSGVIAALKDGPILLRSSESNEWTTLHGPNFADEDGTTLSTLITYGEGIVVGTNDGSLFRWSGPGKDPDPNTWSDNWTQLYQGTPYVEPCLSGCGFAPPVEYPSAVTALMALPAGPNAGGDGLVAGLTFGGVISYDEATGSTVLATDNQFKGGVINSVVGFAGTGYNSAGKPTFAVARTFNIEEWNGTQFNNVLNALGPKDLLADINLKAFSSISQFGENYIVGQKNSAVTMRVIPGPDNPYGAPATLVSSGGGAVSPVPVTVSLTSTYTQGVGTISQSGSSSKARMDFALPTGANPSSFVGATVAKAAQPNAAIGTITSYGYTSLNTVYNSPAGSVYTVLLKNPTYFQNVSSQPLILTQSDQPSQVQLSGGISDGVGNLPGNVLQAVVPDNWKDRNVPGACGLCSDMVGGTISGPGIEGATITGFRSVGTGPIGKNGNVAAFTISGSPQFVGAVSGKSLALTLTQGFDPAKLIGQEIAGNAGVIPAGTVLTGVLNTKPSGETVYSVSQDVFVPGGATVTTPNFYPGGTASTWVELHDAGWGKFGKVNQIVPFQSGTLGTGVVIGLDNGSVQMWNGKLSNNSGQNQWTELHDAGWNSAVKTLVLAPAQGTDANADAGWQDGVVVGLANGATEQWNGTITGTTGQNNWTELVGYRNYATDALAYKEDLSCEQWRCVNKGSLLDGVTFGTTLATAGDGGFQMPPWGTPGGVGGKNDPIFSDPMLQAGSKVSGSYIPIAITGNILGNSLFGKEIAYSAPANLSIGGGMMPASQARVAGFLPIGVTDPCGTGSSDCTVLVVDKVRKFVDGSPLAIPIPPVTAYNDPENKKYFNGGLVVGAGVLPDTIVKTYLGDVTGTSIIPSFGGVSTCVTGCTVFRVSGPAQNYNSYLPGHDLTLAASPSVRVGPDVIPVVYGYAYIPDGFRPKFKPGNWSMGVLAAAKIGPSVTVNTGPGGQIFGPTDNFPLTSTYTPGPLGFDNFSVNTGVKLSAGVTLNGAEKPTLKVYAYTVPGSLFTFNSAGAPGQMQSGFNNYLDFSARDLYNISGVSITATATPYINLAYGIGVPENVKWIGGMSLFKLSAGYENPIYATACGDIKNYCAAGGTNKAANFYGVINDGKSFKPALTGGYEALATAGDTLTVTQSAVVGSQPRVGQVLTGPQVYPGTTITRYLGETGPGGADQYKVAICDADGTTCTPKLQSSVGGRYPGLQPYLSAVTPGSNLSMTIGAQGNLTFHAGLLDGVPVVGSGKLAYNAKIPLYDFNTTFALL